MARIVIATGEKVEGGIVTGYGTLAASLPAANLQTLQPGEVARWTSLATIAADIDLVAAAAVNVVALGPHNGTSAATWRVRGATSQANLTAAPGYDSGSGSMWPATGRPSGYDGVKLWSLLYLSAAQSFRWWRFDVADAANPDGYFEAGRWIVDAAWQPAKNLRYGWGVGWDDPSEIVRAIGGQAWPVPRSRARVLEFTLGSMSEDEMMANAYEIARKRGKAKDVLVARDPAATTHLHRQMIYGLMAELPPLVNRTFNLYETGYRLEELIV